MLMTSSEAGSTLKLDRCDYRLFTPVPTRWGDADALGHINNAMLVRYIECGRIDYFSRVCDLRLGEDENDGFVIANLEMAFLHQVHHPSELEVASSVSRLGNSSFDVDTIIFNKNQTQALISSRAVCVWFDLQNNCSRHIPEHIRNTINQFEQGNLS